MGRLAGACRSKSYHHLASNPPTRGSDSAHSEPTCRRTVRSLHPASAQCCGVRRGHATRYLIVNEHVPREKLLRSATRIPRHYLIAEPPEILELCPHNAECFAPQWDEERSKGKKRMQELRFYADHQSHSYIGEHIKNHGAADKGRDNNPRRYGKTKQEDGEEGTDHLGPRFHSSVTEEDGLQLYLMRQSPVRSKHLKTKIRARQESQSESDSVSPGSSSDPQNSSPDQYIQVIHNRPDAPPSKMSQKRSGFRLNVTESHDLVCSNV